MDTYMVTTEDGLSAGPLGRTMVEYTRTLTPQGFALLRDALMHAYHAVRASDGLEAAALGKLVALMWNAADDPGTTPILDRWDRHRVTFALVAYLHNTGPGPTREAGATLLGQLMR